MKIEYVPNYETMSRQAADLIFAEVEHKPHTLLCAASGKSTLGTYNNLAEKSSRDSAVLENLRVLKLDEWGGIPMDDPNTCETFLQENLVLPLKIPSERYFAFHSSPADKIKECNRIATFLEENGPIDLCILGLGLNGHIAFNEPGNTLFPYCHIAKLSNSSLQHSMAVHMPLIPSYGLSLGMNDILTSRKIILLVSGPGKNKIANLFLSQKISTQLPASLLWLHRNTTCLINEEEVRIN